jgi:hypothetical protein
MLKTISRKKSLFDLNISLTVDVIHIEEACLAKKNIDFKDEVDK